MVVMRLLLLFLIARFVPQVSPNNDTALVENDVCEWKRPPKCNGEPTFKINLHFAKDFPTALKAPFREAAELWSRAIVGRTHKDGREYISKRRKISALAAEYCSLDSPALVNRDEIIVCVNAETLKSHVIASAGCLDVDHGRPSPNAYGLPMVSIILVNWLYVGKYHYCDWTNIALHELAHALGFGKHVPAFKKKIRGNKFFDGIHTQQEWDKLNATTSRPLLSQKDLSHWPVDCFASDELMRPHHMQRNDRIPISRLTMAVMEDLGYQINYLCTDDSLEISDTYRILSRAHENLCPRIKRLGAWTGQTRKAWLRSYDRFQTHVKKALTDQAMFHHYYPTKPTLD